MVKEVGINDMYSLLDLIAKQDYYYDIDRYRSSYLYRGLTNSSFKLESSLQRNCKDKQLILEKSILRNFSKYAATDAPELIDSIWRQLIIGQHHGLPTRLLDWTYSPLIGLNFATLESDLSQMENHNCALWEIDITEIHNLIPFEYKEILQQQSAYLFSVDMLKNITLDKYDSDMGCQSFIILEPPSIDQRIINQYSYFAVIPSGINCFEDMLEKHTIHTTKYIIDKSLRWRIRDMLDQLNINERIMYPGLDGLSSWLKRHYYVK